MSRIVKSFRGVVAVLGVAVFAACAEPPAEAIDAAHRAEQAATDMGAAQYAPAAFDRVAQTRAALDAELTAQSERMAIRRSYKQAEQLATQLKGVSDEAAQAAQAEKDRIRTETTALIQESRMAADSVNARLQVAPVGKGSSADLAALRSDLSGAQQSLTEAESMLASERYLEAREKATAARMLIDQVKAALDQAQQMRRRT